jgi:hypothetical protein
MEDYFLGRCLFTGIGVVVILLGLRVARRGRRLDRAGVRTTATVVEYEEADEGSPFIVVEFEDLAKARRRKRLRCHFNEVLAVGASVDIVYDPDNPGNADWTYNAPLWRDLALCIVGAGIFIVVMAWMPGWMPAAGAP